jgi:HK97 family phage portal protein
MGLFTGSARVQQRDAFGYPDIPPNSQAGSLRPSFTGARVETTDGAMRRIAIYAAVDLIAGVCSSLPVDGYTGKGADRREVPLSSFFTDPDGSGQGFGDWTYQLLYSWLLRGNAVGRIVARDAQDRPSQIVLQHPDYVSVQPDADGRLQWHFGGRSIPRQEVWHRRMKPVPGRTLGMSPIALHAVSIGQGLAAEAFGLRWFEDGAHPSAILQNENAATVTQEQANTVKARFLAAIRGTREPVVLGSGWKYQAVQIAPNESQFLDTQRYTAAEAARIFGPGIPEVLGYETGGSMTYANVEQRSLDLLKFTLDRYLRRIEDVLSTDILARPRYIKLNRDALLATDLLTRYKAHELALKNRFRYVNEVRRIEDLPPVEWGDQPNEQGSSAAALAPAAAELMQDDPVRVTRKHLVHDGEGRITDIYEEAVDAWPV